MHGVSLLVWFILQPTTATSMQHVQQYYYYHNRMTENVCLTTARFFVSLDITMISRVRPMYTSDIENRQHRILLERRQIGISKSPMSMLSKIIVLLRPPNFHCHYGGWLYNRTLQCSRRSFWVLFPENCPALFRRAAIVI